MAQSDFINHELNLNWSGLGKYANNLLQLLHIKLGPHPSCIVKHLGGGGDPGD